MKTLCIILCNVAIALGIVMGRMDYEAEKKVAREQATARAQAEALAADQQALSPPAPPAGRKSHTPQVVSDDFLVGGGAPAQGDPPPEKTFVEPISSAGSLEQNPDGTRFRARLEKLAELLRGHDFAAVESDASTLASETERGPIAVHDKAVQMASKARVFEKIVAQMPKTESVSAAPVAANVSEVLLANGNKIIALKAEEEADRYVFKLQGGATYAPRKEDVLEVRSVKKEVSLAPGWPGLQQKISKLDDSVLLFVDGAQMCYRMGFRKEGLEVLERILARPDSDQIPLLFVPNSDDALLRDWQVAAGRRGGASSDASTASVASVDAACLSKAAQLYGQAQALYQSAAGKEGRENDLKTARERIEKALELVETLPRGASEVTKLRRQLAQLLSDVARASPF